MRALDPLAHGVHLLDAEGALGETHGELLVGRSLREVLGAEAVDDDNTARRGEALGLLSVFAYNRSGVFIGVDAGCLVGDVMYIVLVCVEGVYTLVFVFRVLNVW